MAVFTLQKSDGRIRLKPFALILMLSAVLVSAAYPGSGLSLPLAMAVLILTVGVVIIFTRSVFCILLVTVPLSLVWLYTGGSFEYTALFCVPITVIGVGAFLLKTTRSPYLLGLLPAAYALALLVGDRPIAAMLSLILFPVAYLLAAGFSGKAGRISLLCRISVSLGVIGAALFVIWLTVKNGRFEFAMVSEAVDGMLEMLVDFFTEQYAEAAALYAERGIDISMLAITAADARLYAVTLFGIVPALAVVALNAISFVSYQLAVSLFARSGQKDCLTPAKVSFSMSWESAAVFTLAYFVMLIANLSGNGNVSLVAENIYVILLPGLVLTGVLIALGKGSDGRKHTFRMIFMIVLTLFSPNLALAYAAFSGCWEIFKNAISRRARKDF